ncbi:MAG: hypothetical protein ACOVKF_09220 [Limnohabitans sp.]
MLGSLSPKGLNRQAVKSIRLHRSMGLKKLVQWSILRMYPMKHSLFG